jgi:2-iminobutanoate/2-iminopropanoate deaminase
MKQTYKQLIHYSLLLFILASSSCKNGEIENTAADKQEKKPLTIVKEKWHWGSGKDQNTTAGYAQVVKSGKVIYISGVPTNDLSPEGISEVYERLNKCLKAFGATSKNVVKETLYTTDIEAMKKYNGARKAFYKDDFPAASWVQVSRLYEPNAKLEVELIAHLEGVEE